MPKLGSHLIPDASVTIRPRVVVSLVMAAVVLGTAGFGSAKYVVGQVAAIERVPELDSMLTAHLLDDAQRRRGDSLHHALQDSVMIRLAREFTAAKDADQALTCHVYAYPEPYCRDYRAKAVQAGRQR